jgi:hypothetical protein
MEEVGSQRAEDLAKGCGGCWAWEECFGEHSTFS